MSSPSTPSILKNIIRDKQSWVEARQAKVPLAQVKALAEAAEPPRAFAQALRAQVSAGRCAVIAEIKKASPSKGVIRADFDPVAIALSYASHGAACLSVLTDVPYFQGNDCYLQQVREAVSLPLLRKDFMINSYQIYEARALGADCVLLIAAVLDPETLVELAQIADSIGLSVLVEVHDVAELTKLSDLPNGYLLGVNNRNLHTFEVSLQTTVAVRDAWIGQGLANEDFLISESGIHTQSDIAFLKSAGINCFLIGELLMRAPVPGVALAELLGQRVP